MLFLPSAACLFLATVEILLAGESSCFCNGLRMGRAHTPKIKAGRKPGLVADGNSLET
jgi:hypothetical protein